MKKLTFLVALLTIAVTSLSEAQISRTLSYQGVLSDSLGNPKPNGDFTITFRLYQSLTGGSAIWSETKDLPVRRGLFFTVLGDQSPFPDSARFDRAYWLSIQVGAEPELSPRVPLTSVGYSINSIKADTAKYAMASSSDTVWRTSGSNVYRITGNVGIGSTVPTEKLEVSGNVKATAFIGSGSGLTFTAAQTFSASNSTQVINVTQTGAGGGLVVSTPSASGGTVPMGVAIVGQATNMSGCAGVVGILGSPSSIPCAAVAGSTNTSQSAVEGRHTATGGPGAGVTGTSASSGGIGVQGLVTSPTATAAVFYNIAGGKILSAMGSSTGEVFTVQGSGNVGIGTTAPMEKLEVAGNIKVGNATIRSGTGTPEGVVTGNVADIFLRTDGGTGSTLYVKESGNGTNTGWMAK